MSPAGLLGVGAGLPLGPSLCWEGVWLGGSHQLQRETLRGRGLESPGKRRVPVSRGPLLHPVGLGLRVAKPRQSWDALL